MAKTLYDIYADESRQNKDRFMVLGGIITPSANIQAIDDTMAKFRDETNMRSELKWSKVSNQKFAEYKRFVDFFFSLNDNDKFHFHCLVVDNHKINHHRYNQGDKEVGFYKFYYQLLLHKFGRPYGKDNSLHVRLDHRTTPYSLDDLKLVLNNGYKKAKHSTHEPFRSVEPRNSKNSELMQINDIILGAISSCRNGVHLLAETRQSKRDLAAYVLEKAGIKDTAINTPRRMQRFSIWNFQMRKR